jgi:predicted ArsR family transcriptional regulator
MSDKPPADRHRRILDTLRVQGPKTARELATLLGGGAVGMRAHLRQLGSAGLVTSTMEMQPVGRPVRRFNVSLKADSLFPKRYELLASHLVDSIVEHHGAAGFEKILRSWRDDLARHLDRTLPKSPGPRLEALAQHQSQLGFMAEVEKGREGPALVERNCPIASVAKRHPRICDFEASLFRRVLGRNVALSQCQAKGDTICRFQLARKSS